jgi:hypothetical protein
MRDKLLKALVIGGSVLTVGGCIAMFITSAGVWAFFIGIFLLVAFFTIETV